MTKNEFIQQAMVAMCANPQYTIVEGLKCGEIAHNAERLARVSDQVFKDDNFGDK